ncbi:MAG: septum site-determining protein MinC [Candidatus Wallbacteria bacterium]
MFSKNDIKVEETPTQLILRVSEKISRRSLAGAITEKIFSISVKKENHPVVLDLMTRAITTGEIESLKSDIEKKCNVLIKSVYTNTRNALNRSHKNDQDTAINKVQAANNVLYVKGPVRCGQKIEHNGPITVIGSLNAGGYIKACGPITIMGDCNGELWAYSETPSDGNLFIVASSFSPVKFKLGEQQMLISDIPSELTGRQVICILKNGEIIIRPHPEGQLNKGCVKI